MDDFKKWMSLSKQLKTVKAAEMKLRKELCAKIFSGRVGKETKKFDLENLRIEAKNGVSYKVDSESLQAMWDELTILEKDAIKWSPSLKLTEYKKLDENVLLAECITSKPSAPTLKIKEI